MLNSSSRLLETVGIERRCRDRRQIDVKGRALVGDADDTDAGFEDRPDIAGLEPSERDSTLERGDQRIAAPRRFEGGE